MSQEQMDSAEPTAQSPAEQLGDEVQFFGDRIAADRAAIGNREGGKDFLAEQISEVVEPTPFRGTPPKGSMWERLKNLGKAA